jgi:hypothetical protein
VKLQIVAFIIQAIDQMSWRQNKYWPESVSASHPSVPFAAAVPRVFGHFDPDASAEHVAAVEIVDGVVGVAKKLLKMTLRFVLGWYSIGARDMKKTFCLGYLVLLAQVCV